MAQTTNGEGFAAAAGEISVRFVRTDAEGLETGLATLPGGAPA
jgi:carboxymethylenebutenolidase